MDATDLDILEGWVEEVELGTQKLAAEIGKLRRFVETLKNVGADGDGHSDG